MAHDNSIQFKNTILQMNLEVRDLWDEEPRWGKALNHRQSSREESFHFVRGEASEWSCGGVAVLTSGRGWRWDAQMKNFDWRVVNGSIGCP
ncbi:hypothetical protein NPIL_79791 [Nephila pilipes]|uniref:Uncharacterized protein n=1 Tax=Nephila pilipes TaxID=299642 RepID=A0A8X6NZH2_NEPPI|nr:hypothetical protein NPIL_79791 [Nephila pilipes]